MAIDLAKLSFFSLNRDNVPKVFNCGDEDLNNFILHDAFPSQEAYLSNTTLLYYDGSFVGYFTLACDSLRLEETNERANMQKRIQSYPAIKIARMAFSEECQRQGCGKLVVSFVVGFAQALNKRHLGCRFITVDAYPHRVGFYTKLGFKYNTHKAYKRNNHPSLRLDVWSEIYKPAVDIDTI